MRVAAASDEQQARAGTRSPPSQVLLLWMCRIAIALAFLENLQ